MKHLSIIISSLILYSCSNSKIDLTPLKYDESVKIEIAYDIKTDGDNPEDNLIFSKCNSFEYKYFVEIKGKKYLSKLIDENEFNPWTSYELIDHDSADNEICVDKFLMFAPKEKPTNAHVAPTQSLIKSYWIKNDGKLLMDSSEGIIENYENFWMHPLRSLHMWPTFTAPWPYVDFPLEIGKEYKWWKKLDGGWGSDKYVQWDSIVHFDYNYKVKNTTTIKVKESEIDCFLIHAKGESPIGNTEVDFYFNPKVGFVKMDYLLMDESRIVLYLDNFKLDCEFEPEIPKFK